MEGEEGAWRLGCAGGSQDKTIMNRIMLRFRPIAPKPETGDLVSDGLLAENKKGLNTKGRTKRKYVRVCKKIGYKRKKRSATEEERKDGFEKNIVTLQLLPEKADHKQSPARGSWCNIDLTVTKEMVHEEDPSMWLNCKNFMINNMVSFDPTVVMQQKRVVETWVTVECVTDKCMDVQGLGCTDVERMKNLDVDTCPGFISDGLDKVQWVNGAYRRMVSQQKEGLPPEIRVQFVMKEKLLFVYDAFTCHVKLQYTWGKEKFSQVLPCDVWRMDCGWFAWRLDVEAALSLGR